MSNARTTTVLLPAAVALAGACALLHGRLGEADGGDAQSVRLTWYGQSAFRLDSPGGTVALMDPAPDDLGYAQPAQKADLVTVSHEHFDHIAVAKALGGPRVFRGLQPGGKGWNAVDEVVGDVRVLAVGTWHDASQGKERGLNTVFVFETGGVRLAHLGDLGHPLTDAQLQAIGAVDAVLIPVGGAFTIDARAAWKVVAQLKPRAVVIPMHFKTARMTMAVPIGTVEPFLAGRKDVRRLDAGPLVLTPGPRQGGPEVVLMAVAP